MHTFIALIDFTRKGIDAIEGSIERSNLFRAEAEKMGAKVKDVYWTLGAHDGVLIFEAPDGPTATALLLKLAKSGNVQTHTLRAFEAEEMQRVLGKLG